MLILGAELSNEISEAKCPSIFLNQVIKVRHPKVQQLEPEHGAFQVVSPFLRVGEASFSGKPCEPSRFYYVKKIHLLNSWSQKGKGIDCETLYKRQIDQLPEGQTFMIQFGT